MTPSAVRRAQLVVGGGCLLAAAALGAALDGTEGQVAVDRRVGRLVGPPSPVSGWTTNLLSELADRVPIVLALAGLVVLAALIHRRPQPVLAIVGAGALTQVLVTLSKALVDRVLFTSGASIPPVLYASGPTYPSGHVAGATMVLALAILVVGPGGWRARAAVGVTAAVVPLGTTLGNLWTASHVITDVAGGLLTGGGAALVVWAALVQPGQPWPPAPSPSGERGVDAN